MQHPGRALLGERGQLCLLSNQIVGFFDHQYLWKESSDILVFCMELVIKGRQHLRLTILGVASCASHSIRLQDSDHQYICKESTNLFDFLHEDDHQGKVPCKTISFGQVCRLYLSANQIAGFFDHQYLWKESSDLSMDLYVEIVKVALVWLVVSLIQSDQRIL